MANCSFNDQLDAYHDGELDERRRRTLEIHLVGCGECAKRLAELQDIAEMFAAAPRPQISQIAMHRLHRSVDAAMEHGLLRFAGAVSGIAASVLLVGSMWLSRATDAPQAAPPWVEASTSTAR